MEVTSLALVVVLYGCGVAKRESTDAVRHASEWENDMVAIPRRDLLDGSRGGQPGVAEGISGPSCDVVAFSDGCP